MATAAIAVALVVGWLVWPSTTDDGSTDTAFRPISDILDGEIRFDVDPSGTSAILRLDTTIDVVCSVVYGPTEQFGGLATDTDMAGGGHTDHGPLMTGLEPGTTVFYRVQGTAADGTVYIGEVGNFTTPEPAAAIRTNLALAATVVETSSDFSPAFAGAYAIDGSLATEWSSRGDGDNASILIDLGTDSEITGIGFRTREMADGTAITDSYTVSIDGGESFGPYPAGPGMVVSDFTASGRLLRIDLVSTSGGNTGAVEIEVYGS